jgi:hypothetical protein|tara:strand:- start:816 stop:980 length:165 start_codon:yes stop_codon:yes gene_type:complete
MSKNKKDQKKTYKELVAEYQREGYDSKTARKYASQDMYELMSEKKLRNYKRNDA